MTTMEQTILNLQQLGLSQGEAKVYMALLRFNPATGYELGKKTGLPRSQVYDVLNRLISRQAVYKIGDEPAKYMPVPYDKFLDSLKRDFSRTADEIREQLDESQMSYSLEYIYHISGAKEVRAEMVHIIEGAEKELLLELWLCQLDEVRQALEAARKRGIRVYTMLFSDRQSEQKEIGKVFYHDYMPLEVVENRLKGRHTIIVKDNCEALIGTMQDDEAASWAVTTRDPALVMVAREYIIHDIMIDLLISEYGRDKLVDVWCSNPDIHSIVLDRFRVEDPVTQSSDKN